MGGNCWEGHNTGRTGSVPASYSWRNPAVREESVRVRGRDLHRNGGSSEIAFNLVRGTSSTTAVYNILLLTWCVAVAVVTAGAVGMLEYTLDVVKQEPEVFY